MTEATHGAATQQRSIWRNRNFVILWTGDAVSMLGSRISFLAFPLLVLDLTHSPAQAGLIGLLESLPNALFNLPAGALADRWNRRRTMILCDVGRALALGSIPFTLWIAHLSLPQIAVVAFISGTLDVMFSAAAAGAIPALVETDQLPAAFSAFETTSRGTVMAGSAVAGGLYQLSRLLPFLADAVSYAVSVLSLFSIPVEFQEERSAEDPRSMWKQILEGLSWVWRQPVVRMMNLLVAGSNLIFAAVALVLIVLARQQHASPALIGAVFSVGGIGGVLGSLVSPWVQRRFTVAQVVIGVNWVWALFLPLLIVAPNPIVLGAVFAAMVFVGPVWNVVQGSYQTAIVPDELRSRVNSVGRFISWGTIPLGSGISGLLLQTIGARPAVLFLFVAMLTLAVLSTLSSAIREAPSV